MPRGNKDSAYMRKIGEKTQFKTGEKAAIAGSNGGIKSQAVQRQRRSLKQTALMLLDMDAPLSQQQQALEAFGLENATNADMVTLGLVRRAEKGDIQAYETLRKYDDERNEKEETTYELPARVIGKAFVDVNRNFIPNKTIVFKGGRGGLKSSYISLKIIEIIKNNPIMHACVVRKVAGTLKDSVYAQMKWAIQELNLIDEFDCKVNPLEIRYKKTGQTIYFRGADDPVKLKSIKPPFGYLGILWKEEKDQLSGPEEERSINQSVLRGNGAVFYDLSSYNPPKSRDNWVNKILLEPDPNRIVHSSTYKEAPAEWLGPKFIEDAEHLKEVNPMAYEHEYLGEPNGEGGNVFENIEIRTITDEEVSGFDNIFQGNDWGWYPDPLAFIRLHYDSTREAIFMIDELYENKWPNAKAAEWIKEKGYDDFEIICDSAEKKSVNDFRDLDLRAKPAIKGPGSVEYGMKWLQCRKIVIDPERTPNAYNEFLHYEYERDKEGNVISGYPDRDNHLIDATRYALERYCNKRGNQA